MNEKPDDASTRAARTEGRVIGTRRPLPARASVVIPAHNESAVIGRLLAELQGLPNDIEVVVVCNGCSDDTEKVAVASRGTLRLTIASIQQASKVAALNAGDGIASAFPRVYLDADVRVSSSAVVAVVGDLRSGRHLAARPPLRYDTSGADPIVRAFYRARQRVPYLMDSLWGAGFYAVNDAGRARWPEFPEAEADDYFVAARFCVGEFAVVDTEPVIVSTPRTARALLHTLGRVYELPGQTVGSGNGSSASTLRALIGGGTGSPRATVDTATYLAVAVSARVRSRFRAARSWARDDTRR